MKPLDFYEDRGQLLKETTRLGEIPEFVKQASYVGDDATASDFAVVLTDGVDVRPLFPMVDPGNVSLSAHYLLHNAAELPEEATKTAAMNLSTMLAAFGMDQHPELLKLAGVTSFEELELVGPVVKVASLTSTPVSRDNCVELKSESGINVTSGAPTRYAGPAKYAPAQGSPGFKMAQTKLSHREQIEGAVARFEEEWQEFDPPQRVKIAALLSDEASSAGVALGPVASLYARGAFDLPTALMSIDARRILSAEAEYDDLRKVASLMDADELSSILLGLDTHTGMDRFWGTKLLDPYAAVLSVPLEKTAELIDAGSTTTDSSDLLKLAAEGRMFLLTQFDEKFVAEFQKKPMVVWKSLPEPQQELLLRMAKSHTEGRVL